MSSNLLLNDRTYGYSKDAMWNDPINGLIKWSNAKTMLSKDLYWTVIRPSSLDPNAMVESIEENFVNNSHLRSLSNDISVSVQIPFTWDRDELEATYGYATLRKKFSKIINGDWDSHYIRAAEILVSNGYSDAVISIAPLCNVNGSNSYAKNNEDLYIRAFQHCYYLFKSISENFKIEWLVDPNYWATEGTDQMWPGIDYVDIVGIQAFVDSSQYNIDDRINLFSKFQLVYDFCVKYEKLFSVPSWGIVSSGKTDEYLFISHLYYWLGGLNKNETGRLLYQSYYDSVLCSLDKSTYIKEKYKELFGLGTSTSDGGIESLSAIISNSNESPTTKRVVFVVSSRSGEEPTLAEDITFKSWLVSQGYKVKVRVPADPELFTTDGYDVAIVSPVQTVSVGWTGYDAVGANSLPVLYGWLVNTDEIGWNISGGFFEAATQSKYVSSGLFEWQGQSINTNVAVSTISTAIAYLFTSSIPSSMTTILTRPSAASPVAAGFTAGARLQTVTASANGMFLGWGLPVLANLTTAGGKFINSAINWLIGDNLKPSVTAGSDKILKSSVSTVELSASVIDSTIPTGLGGLVYSWSQTSGPSCTISSPTAVTTNVTLSTSGTYSFRFTASDGVLSSYDDITVTLESSDGSSDPVLKIIDDYENSTTIGINPANELVTFSEDKQFYYAVSEKSGSKLYGFFTGPYLKIYGLRGTNCANAKIRIFKIQDSSQSLALDWISINTKDVSKVASIPYEFESIFEFNDLENCEYIFEIEHQDTDGMLIGIYCFGFSAWTNADIGKEEVYSG